MNQKEESGTENDREDGIKEGKCDENREGDRKEGEGKGREEMMKEIEGVLLYPSLLTQS